MRTTKTTRKYKGPLKSFRTDNTILDTINTINLGLGLLCESAVESLVTVPCGCFVFVLYIVGVYMSKRDMLGALACLLGSDIRVWELFALENGIIGSK